MKKILFTLLICFVTSFSFADSILLEGFEYANHDMTPPIGWSCDDQSWLCGYQEKDHNRIPHNGNWYAFTNADDSWMFMEMSINTQLKYRYFFWAISDGEFDVEFWTGNCPSSSEMTTLLFTKTVNSGMYEQFSEFIETVAANHEYFGIHAIAHEGASHLTLDDIEIDMVNRYEFSATPTNSYTSAYPGEQVTFSFDVKNLGYEPITAIFSPSHDYFNNIHFTVEGSLCNSFNLEPDETKKVVAEATLLPSITAGTVCFLDVRLVLDCNCATAMTTLWVTVMDPSGIAEIENDEGLRKVEVFDLTGKKVDPSHLKTGVYIERTVSEKGISTRKIVKQ